MGFLQEYKERKRQQAEELERRKAAADQFPETDINGCHLFKTDQFILTGTRHKHDGNRGDTYLIKESIIGEDVQLVWDKNNRYDDTNMAVKVMWQGHYLGWLPMDSGMRREPIVLRLSRGLPVPARIKDLRSVTVRERTGERDEDGNEIWEDVLTASALVVVAIYDLPQKGKKIQQEPAPTQVAQHPSPQSVEKTIAAPASEPKKTDPERAQKQARLLFPLCWILTICGGILMMANLLPALTITCVGIYGTTLRRTANEQMHGLPITPIYKRKSVIIGVILLLIWGAICVSI